MLFFYVYLSSLNPRFLYFQFALYPSLFWVPRILHHHQPPTYKSPSSFQHYRTHHTILHTVTYISSSSVYKNCMIFLLFLHNIQKLHVKSRLMNIFFNLLSLLNLNLSKMAELSFFDLVSLDKHSTEKNISMSRDRMGRILFEIEQKMCLNSYSLKKNLNSETFLSALYSCYFFPVFFLTFISFSSHQFCTVLFSFDMNPLKTRFYLLFM
jgi:hypothetical protein